MAMCVMPRIEPRIEATNAHGLVVVVGKKEERKGVHEVSVAFIKYTTTVVIPLGTFVAGVWAVSVRFALLCRPSAWL